MATSNNGQQVNVQYFGTNTEARVEGHKLHLIIDLDERHGPSSTGVSEMIASTGGGVMVPGFEGIKVNCTVYKPYPKQPRR